ncbi:hypothetical protein BCR42DRAFT_400730 [Absidia repens]|uniref:Suv3 C-terminal domain-containing protein n=1 Tax=Absidia repens TaxID=90262 RepID=A0A1X2J1H5_9FUNG|nr:hypothetical protein BCR42DRAFT_400730 [Absidia repens]
MIKRFCLEQICFTQQQRYLATTRKQGSNLIARLKKGRPDLKAITEPRQVFQWAQKVVQSRWKVWIHASKARYLSASLFELDAKKFSDLAQNFVNCGSKGQLPSCQPSVLLANGAYMLSYKELVETIDRRLLASFYDYALPNLRSSLQQLKLICQFSPTTWFPHSRSLARSIYVHKYNTSNQCQDRLLETIHRTTTESTTVYCGNNTWLSSSLSTHTTCTHLNYLDYTVRHIPALNRMILDMDESLQQQDWRWTKAFLNTQSNTVHILMAMDHQNNNNRWIRSLEQIVKDRGEQLTVIDHRDTESTIDTSYNHARNLTRLGALQSWQDIQSGDCIVVKSRHMMLNMKDRLEHDYGFKCSILFPQLPEAIQIQQIDTFNDTDSSPKVLLMTEVADTPSKIHAKRLLFKSIKKQHNGHFSYDSTNIIKRLTNVIEPTQAIMMFDKTDIPFIRQAIMAENPLSLQQTLCVLPSSSIFETFCDAMPKEMAMSSKMDAFEVLTDVSGVYMLGNWNRQKLIADWLEHYSLTFDDRWTFMNAPLDVSLTKCKTIIQLFGEAVSRGTPCELDDVFGLPLNSTTTVIKSRPLMTLVNQYHIIQWYHWFKLEYPAIFVTDETVLQRHQHQYQTIILENLSSNHSQLTDRRKKRRQDRKMGQLVEQLLGQTSAKPALSNYNNGQQGTK